LPLARLQSLYNLTRAEADIANLLLEGLSLEQISEQRLVSLDTVRSQVKTLLAKTGSSRQSTLIKKLSALPRLIERD
jgi:DNA-binding CsgD family transcriptional regulator